MLSDVLFLVAELNPTLSQVIRRLDKQNYSDPEIEKHAVKHAHLIQGYVGTNNLSKFEKYLHLCHKPDDINKSLAIACRTNNEPMIGLLLKDVRINYGTHDNALLRWACLNRRVDYMRMLMNKLSVNLDFDNNWLLHTALTLGFTEIVDMLIHDGRVRSGSRNSEVLRIACRRGYTSIVRYLLELADVHPDDCENDAILFAAGSGHYEIVQMLLSKSIVNPSVRHNLPLRWAFIKHTMKPTDASKKIIDLLMADERVIAAGVPVYM